jgi:serine/threonine protein kinase
MGVVYLAEQREPIHRYVALKLIKLGMSTKAVVARFESERQALALMNHQSIARVFDAGSSEDGRPYFVMEHVPGQPITEFCDEHRMPTRERLRLFVQVCDAIQHAHQKAIIHRDIKPSNVLVMEQETHSLPKIIDFGIAKALHQRLTDKTYRTLEGQLIGTPEYMSPEQLAGEDVDTRTDTYSLGLLLYELLVGQLPFDPEQFSRSNVSELQRVVREVDPPRPSSRPGHLRHDAFAVAQQRQTNLKVLLRKLRGDLDWIALKALERDPSRRYQTASNLAADVERHLRHEPVSAGPPSLTYRARKFVLRNRIAVLEIVSIVLTVAGLFAFGKLSSELKLSRGLNEGKVALSQGNEHGLRTARKILAVLEQDHFGDADVRQLRFDSDALDNALRAPAALDLITRGKAHSNRAARYLAKRSELAARRLRLSQSLETWQPVWERAELFPAEEEIRDIIENADRECQSARHLFQKARAEAPLSVDARLLAQQALDDLDFLLFQEADRRGGSLEMSSEHYCAEIVKRGLGAYSDALAERGEVIFESDQTGAEVFCFRYQPFDGHLLPLPFDPAAGIDDPGRGVLREPSLRIERILSLGRDSEMPFEKGDRWMRVNSQRVELRSELAGVLESVTWDEIVEVERRDRAVTLRWCPYPSAMRYHKGKERKVVVAGTIRDIPLQFGFNFEGTPVEPVDGCRVGVTAVDSLINVKVPRGRYLFVFRKPRYHETRLPVYVPLMPDDTGRRRIRLLRSTDVPKNFTHVPGGIFWSGVRYRDRAASYPRRQLHFPSALTQRFCYQSLSWQQRSVSDFLIQRHEVTLGEYQEFLNDTEIRARIKDGAVPFGDVLADWTSETLGGLRPKISGDQSVRFVPRFDRGLDMFVEQDGRWEVTDRFSLDFPVMDVSLVAAVEYAHWFTSPYTSVI